MSDYSSHYSVLNKEVIDLFKQAHLESGSRFFADLTFGAGGHTFALLNKIEQSFLHCFDQDHEAYQNGLKLIENAQVQERVKFHNENFSRFKDVVDSNVKFAGIVLDAGVSSHHFDSGERGFSFRFEAPLDMRMNQEQELTAADIVNTYEASELEEVLYSFGEEKFTKNIVKNILIAREKGRIETTKEMEEICFHSYPKKLRHGNIHPATKTFQALRIEVNKELDVLSDVIGQLLPYLEVGGMIAIISFHSLEDRIVKKAFKAMTDGELPVQIVTKKPIVPGEQEIFENSRSRSAKLRVVKRVEKWPTKNKYPRA